MDPATATVLVGLGGKAIEAGVQLIKAWRERGGGGVVLGTDGSRFDLAPGGSNGLLDLTEPRSFGLGDPVPFNGVFVAADEWAHAYLHAAQPVLVVIEDLDQGSRLDAVVAVVPLGSSFEGHLFPSTYRLGAFVFLDEESIDWGNLDGGALIEFSVHAWDPPFLLQIPIEAVTDASNVLFTSGHLGPGQQDQYLEVFERGFTYEIYVNPIGSEADFDLYLYDENDSLIDVDDNPDSDALCTVTPRWTGPFKIVVECHSGRSDYVILVEQRFG
jgi:hypothetical protein